MDIITAVFIGFCILIIGLTYIGEKDGLFGGSWESEQKKQHEREVQLRKEVNELRKKIEEKK